MSSESPDNLLDGLSEAMLELPVGRSTPALDNIDLDYSTSFTPLAFSSTSRQLFSSKECAISEVNNLAELSASTADEAYSSTKVSIDSTSSTSGQRFPWEVAYLTPQSLDVSKDSITENTDPAAYENFSTLFTQKVESYITSCTPDIALSIKKNCDEILSKYNILCKTYTQALQHHTSGHYGLSDDAADHAKPYLKLLDLITHFLEQACTLTKIDQLTNAIRTSLDSINCDSLATGHAIHDIKDLNCIKHVSNALQNIRNKFEQGRQITPDLIETLNYSNVYLSKITLDTTIDDNALEAFLHDPLSTSRDADDEQDEEDAPRKVTQILIDQNTQDRRAERSKTFLFEPIEQSN